MEYLLVAALFAIIAYFWWRGRTKKKNEAWEGVIENKEEVSTTDSEGDSIDWYYFDIKLTDGTMKYKYEVSSKVFEKFDKGDKIVKRAGELDPTKG